MKTICKIAAALMALLPLASLPTSDVICFIDAYKLKMCLQVPRVYSNTQSRGYRKYQMQLIEGQMLMMYNENGFLVDVQFKDMANKTHKMADGSYVTYGNTRLGDFTVCFNAIGSNATGVFKTSSICFGLDAEPNYSIGEFDEDNALYVVLAGKGSFLPNGMLKGAKGNVVGTLGCGCSAYGHLSPTRKISHFGPSNESSDIAAVFGTWMMKLIEDN